MANAWVEGAKWVGKRVVGGGILGGAGGVGMGLGQSLLGSLGGPEQEAAGPDLGSAGAVLMPQSGSGSGTNVAPGRTVVVSAPTPAPDPSLKVIAGLVTQALGTLNKIDSNISAQRSEQAAAAASSAKQLREATLEGAGKAELAASPQMAGSRVGGTGILGALGTAAGALAVYNYMTGDKKEPGSADAAAGSDGTPAPGPGDAVAPDGSLRGGFEKGLNNLRDWVMGDDKSGSNDVSKGGALFDPLKGKGTGRNQPGLGLKRGIGGTRGHEGIDLFVPIGTPVYAVADGKLRYSDRRKSGPGYGFGLAVCIDHGGGWETKYAHLSRLVFNKKDARPYGPKIARGQLIGYSGDTGNAKGTTPHLHFEVRYKDVAQEASQYLTGQKTIPGAKVAAVNQESVRDSAPAPSSSDDVKQAQNDAAPVEAPTATGMTPRVMNASYTPSEQGSNAFGSGDANDPSRYNNLGPGGLPDEQSTLKPEYTKIGASLGMVGTGAPMVQNALYRSSADVPGSRVAPPKELEMPTNDNTQKWLEYLKQEYKKPGSKFAQAIEAWAKKLAVKYPTLSKGLMKATKNPKALLAIGGAIAVGVGVDWLTSYLREKFPEGDPLTKPKPDKKPVTPAPAPVTPAPAPVTPTPQPDAKPALEPDTRTVPGTSTQLEPTPGTGTGPAAGGQPTPATGTGIIPVDPADTTSVIPPVSVVIPLVPAPEGFKKPKPVTPPGDLERIYSDRPGLTFKDREYDATRATGVSRGSGQLGLGRSEPQTGVIGEPLLLPPTPSFTPDSRANDIDSMSREREKSSRAPLKFDSGTPDAYTPPAKTQLARNESDAANGGTGAGPSSVPNPSAYDIVKEYQLYFLNPSAVLPVA